MQSKTEVESELAKLLDSYNIVYKEYKTTQKKLKAIRKEKKELQIIINKKLNEYRKFI